MNTQAGINYQRIAKAIDYIKKHFKEQPSLDALAKELHLSPFHFQRLFSDWAGVSPKKFIQYLSIDYAKSLLREKKLTLFDAALETGLSGTGRLHDLFVSLEGMTPGEYKNGGAELRINYGYAVTLFGEILVASTTKGICYLAFIDGHEKALVDLKQQFPNAEFKNQTDPHQQQALRIFMQQGNDPGRIKVHLKGTDFQIKVWEALLNIPMGDLSTYGNIAAVIENPKASRAVGSAIGNNPVAFIIPCHRVIQSNGAYGEYRWGSTRKSALIGWEASKAHF